VHYFRNAIAILKGRGHKVLATARRKPIIQQLLDAYERYEQVFLTRPSNIVDTVTSFVAEHFDTPAEAEAKATELGGSGYHEHKLENGKTVYMPFNTHEE